MKTPEPCGAQVFREEERGSSEGARGYNAEGRKDSFNSKLQGNESGCHPKMVAELGSLTN